MKKVVLFLLFAFTVNLNGYCQYDYNYYTSSSDKITSDILFVFYLFFIVLNTILFFKIWEMANRINSIEKIISHDKRKSINELFLTGDKEEIKKELIMYCSEDILRLGNEYKTNNTQYNHDHYVTQLEELKKKYEKLLSFVGCELPNVIKEIKDPSQITNIQFLGETYNK